MNACPFGRCEGDGRIPLRYSEGGDGATHVSWGACPKCHQDAYFCTCP